MIKTPSLSSGFNINNIPKDIIDHIYKKTEELLFNESKNFGTLCVKPASLAAFPMSILWTTLKVPII